jgi:hypothetical protein
VRYSSGWLAAGNSAPALDANSAAMTAALDVDAGSEIGGGSHRELVQGVADDPGPMAVVGVASDGGLDGQEDRGRFRVQPREGAQCPGECLLDVRLGIANQLRDQPEASLDDGLVSSGGASAVWQRGQRGADEAPLPPGR